MGSRKFFESEWDYISYTKAENALIKSEKERVKREAHNPNFWINYFGIIAMLILPKALWWKLDFKGNPCKRSDGSWMK